MKNSSNKSRVLECYRQVIRDRKSELIDNYFDDAYIQHSPSLKDGKAALHDAIEYLKKMPPANGPSPFVMAIEDGDFVALLLHLNFMGRKMVADIFRLYKGKIIEHWDAMQGLEDPTIAVLLSVEEAEKTDSNKALIADLFADVGTKVGTNRQYVSTDYIEHSVEVFDSGQPFDKYMINGLARTTVHRILGEGNFVVVQSEECRPKAFACYDFFRIDGGLIAEHWSVVQPVPDTMPHTNGMI